VPERVPSFNCAARIAFLKARILSLSPKPATLPSKARLAPEKSGRQRIDLFFDLQLVREF
jgi:hypothetical protein